MAQIRDLNSFFAKNPTNIDIPRAKFKRPQKILTTADAGKLIPFFVDEILPGDTFSVDTSILARMSTPIHPVMDDCYIDYYYFFVPNRLTWEHWEEFNGANDEPWAQPVEYEIPQITTLATDEDVEYSTGNAYCFYAKSVADYMGIPTLTNGYSVNALPFRAYALIWNEWFRDQNLQESIFVPKDDNTRRAMMYDNSSSSDANIIKGTAINGSNNCIIGGACAPVSKYHDYFTSALPYPQKGPNVPLPVEGIASVYGDANRNLLLQGLSGDQLPVSDEAGGSDFGTTVSTDTKLWGFGAVTKPGDDISKVELAASGLIGKEGDNSFSDYYSLANPMFFGQNLASKDLLAYFNQTSPVYADVRASIGSINDLRLAFAIQRLYEKDARGGTRYREILQSHFGVVSPDSRVQIPEYLGGTRVRVGMQQVLQTSASNEVSPQGNTAAYSLTADNSNSFTKSFVEHGFLIGVMCIRYQHSYQQGIERMWSRKNRFDFYWPTLANIGELPILNKEIYTSLTLEYELTENDPVGEQIFGFQEAFAEYRYKPNRISGAFRSNYPLGSLDVWHYGDYYESQPYLSSSWITEDPANIDRTLAVSSEVEDQFIIDITVDLECTRPMPLYSIPGLIDHM